MIERLTNRDRAVDAARLVAIVVGCVTCCAATDSARGQAVGDETFATTIRPILKRYCFECHAEQTAENDLRLDTVSLDFSRAKTVEGWKEISRRLAATSDEIMPPAGKPRPSAEELRTVQAWAAQRLSEAAVADAASQKAEGRAPLRRLNRTEYNNTLRDLLAIDLDLRPLLPEDETTAGFDNVGNGLQITRIHQERYLEATEAALNAALATGPEPKRTAATFKYRKTDYPPRRMLEDDAVAFFISAPAELQQFRPNVLGNYRLRIHAAPYQNPGRSMVVHVNCGSVAYPDERYLAIGPDRTTVLEFTARMGPGSIIRIAPYGLGRFYIRDLPAYEGPGLKIESVDVDGPIIDVWPPEGYRRLLGSYDLKTITADEAERVVRDFLPRVFRRPVSEAKAQPYLAFLRARIDDASGKVEVALRQTLVAVLCSPDFLLLREAPGPLDDFALASRLSYFLWRTMPDAPLLELAAQGQLRSPDVLRRQVDRMLQDPKAAALGEDFLGQWLALRQIDATAPDKTLYPEFDDYLKYSMLREPVRFFEELLTHDLSLKNLIDSEFSLLNDRLAKHYGIAGIEGPEFRRVALPPDSHRGGVMTMAAVLKVTANGTVTSPVLRGVWLHDRILGQPLELPSNLMVPAVEPDIRGAQDIREQLAKHRSVAQCAACHRKIDPYGFALENFDPIGGYRTQYRALGKNPKAAATINKQPVQYSYALPVQAGDVLPNGKRFADADEFKKLLYNDPEPVIRAVAEKLIVYATGSPLRPADGAAVERVMQRLREHDYGARTLVHEVVQSELFLNK
jgi:hypothetical protein